MNRFSQNQFDSHLLKVLAIVLVPVVAGIGIYVKILWDDKSDFSPWVNGYVAPSNVYEVVKTTQKATVVVSCSNSQGSGFGFFFMSGDKARFAGGEGLGEREFERTRTSRVVISNYHVIQDCVDTNSITVITSNGKKQSASILTTDPESDLAALVVSEPIPALTSINYKIRTGYWSMAVGAPFNMAGTTTFGSIIFTEGQRIYTSASLNRGNSGGPLVDNVGLVYGINTGYQAMAQNINWAIDVNALCRRIAVCTGKNGMLFPVKPQ